MPWHHCSLEQTWPVSVMFELYTCVMLQGTKTDGRDRPVEDVIIADSGAL